MTDDTQTLTDISDQTWNSLTTDMEHSILRELAGEREGVNGNGSTEEIAAGLLAFEDRADEVPEEYQHHIDADAEPPEESDESEGAESDDESGEDEPEGEEAPDDDETDEDAEQSDDGGAEEDAEEDTEDSSSDAKLGSSRDRQPSIDSTFIIDADVFETWLGKVSVLVDEAKVHINEDGLTIRAVDPANVGMTDTTLDSVAFESYDIGGEGIIGFNVERVEEIVGGANAGQLLSIDYDAERANIVLKYGGHEFTVSLIDPQSIRKEPDLPNLDLPVRAEVMGRDLKDAIKNADRVTDHAGFESYQEGRDSHFTIYGEGDMDDYTWDATGGDPENEDEVAFLSVPPATGTVMSLFSLDYLKEMQKAFPAGRVVTVDHGSEFPLRIKFAVENDDEAEVGSVTYMLAPRIQSD